MGNIELKYCKFLNPRSRAWTIPETGQLTAQWELNEWSLIGCYQDTKLCLGSVNLLPR